MNADDAFERILEALYEAALDDARWPAATKLIEEAVGTGRSAVMVGEESGEDFIFNFARIVAAGEDREDLARAYFTTWYERDEGFPRLGWRPPGQLVQVRDLYTEDELKTSPVYNEGLRLMGNQKGLYAHFWGADGSHIGWCVGNPRDGGDFQSDQLRLHERLLPHIRRTVSIRQALAAADALGAGLAGLLESDRIGVVQLDRGGRVLAANAPALAILRRGDALVDRDGALDARLPADRSRLRRLLGGALPDLFGAAPSGGSMTVQRPAARSRLGLHVMPVGDAEADFGGRRVAALVLVVDPARRPRLNAARLAVTLGLSPSEGRTAALLAEGLKVREIAAAQGWSENYVRWLVQQCYRKLDVSGQAALVRVVLAADALPGR